MARIRSIKPEFWTSEQVMECSTTARLLFIGIWNFCDDAGNHVASPRTIKANVLPADDIESSSVQGLLDELYTNGLIDFYIVDSKRYLHVTGWHHQRIDKPTYKHPEYRQGENDEKSITARRTLPESSPTEWSGEEWSGIGVERKEAALPQEERPAPEPKADPPPPSEPEKFQTVPDAAQNRVTQIAVLLRRNGADSRTHPGTKGIADLAQMDATDVQILSALETGKLRRKESGSVQPVTAAYLVPIVRELQNPPPEKPAPEQDRWWTSNAGIDRKGRELGLFARGNEDYASFKDRIFDFIKSGKAGQGATA